MKQKIVIIGVNKLTQQVIAMVELENKYTIVGLIDLEKFTEFSNLKSKYPVYNDIASNTLFNKDKNVGLGVICIRDNALRQRVFEKIVGTYTNFKFINVIHPTAVFGKNIQIGKGNIIGPKVIMNSDSKLGNFCIIKDRVSIGHESSIENYVSIETNATLGGNIMIGFGSHIGMSSNIVNDIAIAENCIIQENALVLHNIPNNSRVSGIPAKVIHSY